MLAWVDDLAFARRLSTGYGLVQRSFSTLVHQLEEIKTFGPEQLWTVTRHGEGRQAVRALRRLSHPASRYVLLPLDQAWCAVVDNRRDGPDFADFQRWIEPWCSSPTIRVVDRPAVVTVANGFREVMGREARIFDFRSSELRRSVSCTNDGGRWIFETSGEPLPAEAGFPYDARRKSDRFGSQHLITLLQSLGTRPLTADDLMDPEQSALLEITHRDPVAQERVDRLSCTPEEADDPAYGYWLRASTWIAFMDSHAESVVHDLTLAMALNPAFAQRARPHLIRAREVLGERAYEAAESNALSGLRPVSRA